MIDNMTTDLLKLIYIELTESGTEKKASVRADLIGMIKDSTRGHTDVYINMELDDGKILQVLESRQDIIDTMAKAYLQLKSTQKDVQ